MAIKRGYKEIYSGFSDEFIKGAIFDCEVQISQCKINIEVLENKNNQLRELLKERHPSEPKNEPLQKKPFGTYEGPA